MHNVIFIHVAAINNYTEVLDELKNKINLELINYIQAVQICISGNSVLKSDGKYVVNMNNTSSHSFEFPTLEKIKSYCKTNPNVNVLYLHSKGITDPNNECINDWRKYMTYFLVEKFDKCLDALNDYDTCGVDLRQHPALHYSGNFWWAKASHINTLPQFHEMPVILSERHKAEFWICSKSDKHLSLWDSQIDQFKRHLCRYPEEMYRNK